MEFGLSGTVAVRAKRPVAASDQLSNAICDVCVPMNLTSYHAKYFAHELTKRCSSDSAEKLAGAVASAQVDLNPHQVDAALFAFNSPLSRGALLADEVGLGKTIGSAASSSRRRERLSSAL